MKVLYLDESGNHNLKEINPDYPVFVLGGVIVDYVYAQRTLAPAIRDFKWRHFNRESIVLHTRELFRPHDAFAFLTDPEARTAFYADLNTMLDGLEFKIIACVIKKPQHIDRYQERARDPYDYSLDMILERFCRELENEDEVGLIYAERRNPGADRDLITRWQHLRTHGTHYVDAGRLCDRMAELVLVDKKPNIAGMQLADLIVSPIGRWQAGKAPAEHEVSREMVIRKLCNLNGRYDGVGLVVRPKNERLGTA